jgi:hypothetical protein
VVTTDWEAPWAALAHDRFGGRSRRSVALVAAALADDVVLDLGGIERITSFGVREWMRFMKQLPQGVTGIYVINAPVVVVDQLSMVEGFAGVAKILTPGATADQVAQAVREAIDES